MTDAYDKIANQDYLTGKQLTFLSLVIIIVIQSIPLMIDHSPELEWLLLGFTAAVSACAVVGAILVQFNADKMAKIFTKRCVYSLKYGRLSKLKPKKRATMWKKN